MCLTTPDWKGGASMRRAVQWRSEEDSRRWLSMLVAAMDDAAEERGGCGSRSSLPLCSPSKLEELLKQLSLPASLQSYPTSVFSFRN